MVDKNGVEIVAGNKVSCPALQCCGDIVVEAIQHPWFPSGFRLVSGALSWHLTDERAKGSEVLS